MLSIALDVALDRAVAVKRVSKRYPAGSPAAQRLGVIWAMCLEECQKHPRKGIGVSEMCRVDARWRSRLNA